jgi:hypothetical protein
VGGASGASIKLSGASTVYVSANSSGAYSFSGIAAGLYTVTPGSTSYTFMPASLAVKVGSGSASGVNFTPVPDTGTTYSISGTVSGAVAAGVAITLNGANSASATTDLGGNYSFTGLVRGTYSVGAALAGYSFSPVKVVTLGGADSSSNDFTSSTVPGSASIALAVVNPPPEATVGVAYSSSLIQGISGGSAPYHYQTGSYATGLPPAGMIVNASGVLTGTPQVAGKYYFTVCATDSAGNTTASCGGTWLTVAAAGSGNSQGASGTSWVYEDGTLDWPGDYSAGVSVNYADSTGDPLSGAYDIRIALTQSWGLWQPYALNWDFNLSGYNYLIISLKPTVANQSWRIYSMKVGDKTVINSSGGGENASINNYGPAPQPGVWASYKIPLSAFLTDYTSGTPVLLQAMYKFAIQDTTGLSGNTWYVDNVGFTP